AQTAVSSAVLACSGGAVVATAPAGSGGSECEDQSKRVEDGSLPLRHGPTLDRWRRRRNAKSVSLSLLPHLLCAASPTRRVVHTASVPLPSPGVRHMAASAFFFSLMSLLVQLARRRLP